MPDPLNKLFAILTPGIGYLAGHGLDVLLTYYANGEPRRQRSRIVNGSVGEIKESILLIEKEIIRIRRTQNNDAAVAIFEEMLSKANIKLALKIKELTGLEG